jgi:hypothetical protein
MSTLRAPRESRALMEALARVDPGAATACSEWTAHELVAHQAAGAKEIADLIEDALAGRPVRATKSFDEREAGFNALPDDQLRQAMVTENRRRIAATEALAARGAQPTFEFTGRPFTAGLVERHSRSEAAIHRWDLVGDDAEGEQLLAQPEFTRHAVEMLNTLPILAEGPAARVRQAGVSRLRIVLRSPGEPDVVLAATADGARFELVDNGPAEGDAVVTTDAANRLLSIWGRRSVRHRITIEADPSLWATVNAVLWPFAVRWPPDSAAREAPRVSSGAGAAGQAGHGD